MKYNDIGTLRIQTLIYSKRKRFVNSLHVNGIGSGLADEHKAHAQYYR